MSYPDCPSPESISSFMLEQTSETLLCNPRLSTFYSHASRYSTSFGCASLVPRAIRHRVLLLQGPGWSQGWSHVSRTRACVTCRLDFGRLFAVYFRAALSNAGVL